MTWRIHKGKRLNGSFGFDVSRPGFDVQFANAMQLAFSSDYVAPVKVISGSLVIGPTSGPAPNGGGVYPGAIQSVATVGFGRSVSPIPILYAIASAPGWNVPLATAPTAQLGYLANQWHTYLFETLPVSGIANDNTYGPIIGRAAGSTTLNMVDPTWASAKFIGTCFNDRIEFRYNGNNNLTVKYLVLES